MFLHSILIKQVPVNFNIYTEITLDLFWDLMKHQLLHFDFFFLTNIILDLFQHYVHSMNFRSVFCSL